MKKISEELITADKNFSKFEKVIFKSNNLDVTNENFFQLFPDLNPNRANVCAMLKKLNGTDEFCDLVKKFQTKNICIMGDYDADGILATSIMMIGLSELGYNVDFIIPNRIDDDYGLAEHHIDRAIEEKRADLIITVDNGVSCKEQVEYAKSKGLEVIITDHHLPTEGCQVDNALVIDPMIEENPDPICGAMVAFKLIMALFNSSRRIIDVQDTKLLDELFVFAGIATITDMMPLLGENRLIVRGAIDIVNDLKRKNHWGSRILRVIKGFGNRFFFINPRTKNIRSKVLTVPMVSFYIGPTINATGRVQGDVECVVRDIIDCKENMNSLYKYQDINEKRKEYSKILSQSITRIKEPVAFKIYDPSEYDFRIEGLQGIVASRLIEKGAAIGFAGFPEGSSYAFSCRSAPGYSLHDGFERIKKEHPELGISGGGHDSAMGVKIVEEDIEPFRQYLLEDYSKYREDAEREEKILFEPVYLNEITQVFQKYQHFGYGFKFPVFMSSGIVEDTIPDMKLIRVSGVWFETFQKDLHIGDEISFDFEFSNEYDGEVTLRIKNLRRESSKEE